MHVAVVSVYNFLYKVQYMICMYIKSLPFSSKMIVDIYTRGAAEDADDSGRQQQAN